MRSRMLLPFGMLGVGVPAILLIVPHIFYVHTTRDYIGAFDGWSPTPAQIATQVGPARPGMPDKARQVRFANLFQQRYRSHSQAVGVHFTGPRHMKLMFAAMIPRWDMAHVAIAAHQEALRDLGKDMNIDIYETYISIPQRKVAELRALPAATGGQPEVSVVFDPRFSKDYHRDLVVRPANPLPRFVLPFFYMDPGTWPLLSGAPMGIHRLMPPPTPRRAD